MMVPSSKFTVADVVRIVGPKHPVEVIEASSCVLLSRWHDREIATPIPPYSQSRFDPFLATAPQQCLTFLTLKVGSKRSQSMVPF